MEDRLKPCKVVYVTGAPASGKSSTLTQLGQRFPDLHIWEYGARLTSFLQNKGLVIKDQDELRSRSGEVAQPSDIEALDEQLLEWVTTSRLRWHTLIDSHPVTKEHYGFRVTAFSIEKFKQLHPDEIWLFYVAPEVTLDRIARNPAGRPNITLEEARMHNAAQASVACTFGIAAGCPVYMFDTDICSVNLIDKLAAHLIT